MNITHEQIAQRAYEVFLRNGGKHGQDIQNWLQAEAELKLEVKQVAAIVAATQSIPATVSAVTAAVANTKPSLEIAPVRRAASKSLKNSSRKIGSRIKLN